MFIGVLRVEFLVPNARSLKDGRSMLVSLRDRVRSRFDVSAHEIPIEGGVQRRALAITTAGVEPRLIRSTLDKLREFLNISGDAFVTRMDVDVFRWEPSGEIRFGQDEREP